MITGLTLALEDAINQCFEKLWIQKLLPLYKLKWVQSQTKKDHYTQILTDEMQGLYCM